MSWVQQHRWLKDLLASISIWKCYISKDVLYFLELISSNCCKIWINLYDLLVLTISFTNTSWLQYFLKQNKDFCLYHRKGPLRVTCSTSFIYLCLAGPDLNQDVCQGSWGKMTLQGYEKFITVKYQVMNNKYIHYFVHYMTASFRMLHVFFL